MSSLCTARLVLRPPDAGAAAAIVAGCSDPDVARYIPVIPVPYTEPDARRWLAGADERWRTSRERALAITLPHDDELLGVVSVRLRPGGSIGYWLRSHVRGRGFMTEAVRGLADWANEEHGLSDLFLAAHPDNVASQRVAEKAGFVGVGLVQHEPAFADGTRHALRFEQRR